MKEYIKADIEVVELDADVILSSPSSFETNSSEIPDSDSTIEQ